MMVECCRSRLLASLHQHQQHQQQHRHHAFETIYSLCVYLCIHLHCVSYFLSIMLRSLSRLVAHSNWPRATTTLLPLPSRLPRLLSPVSRVLSTAATTTPPPPVVDDPSKPQCVLSPPHHQLPTPLQA